MKKTERKFLTTRQLAKELNVTRQTIINWVNAGKLPHYNLGKMFRFDLDEVMKTLEKYHKKPVIK